MVSLGLNESSEPVNRIAGGGFFQHRGPKKHNREARLRPLHTEVGPHKRSGSEPGCGGMSPSAAIAQIGWRRNMRRSARGLKGCSSIDCCERKESSSWQAATALMGKEDERISTSKPGKNEA